MTFRLATVDQRAVLIDGEGYHDLETASNGRFGPDPMAALRDVQGLHDTGAALGLRRPDGRVEAVTLGPPVPRPRNVFAIGLNYRDHAEESGLDLPEVPLVFTKFPSCVTGPTDDIALACETADWEAELIVVIGTPGRDIAADDAWEHVAGITAGQDVSDRALQFAAKPPHFDLGKSRDTYGPIGPVLVSTDCFDDPDDIALTCDINGERRQDGRTSGMVFGVPTLVEYLSSILTLEPGDLIFTGTPAGVGMASGTFLRPGDEVVTTVEGVGTMTNRCV